MLVPLRISGCEAVQKNLLDTVFHEREAEAPSKPSIAGRSIAERLSQAER